MRKQFVPAALAALLLVCSLLCGCKGEKTEQSDVDIDFTVMNAAMRYAEVSNIVQDPDSYKGKTARLVGYFAPYPDGEKNGVFTTGRVACEMPDWSNCCAQIIEFVLAQPDGVEFPETGRKIIVEGTIDVYAMAFGIPRCQLIDAKLQILRGGL